MDTNYCQSCSMPLGDNKELYGTNSNGSINEDYCKYCFEEGKFTSDLSMEEMIEVCVPHVIKSNDSVDEEMARKMMLTYFPKLKRWKE